MALEDSGASAAMRRSASLAGSREERFAEFFRDVHGYQPFPWQARLAERVVQTGRWPGVIDLPTGTGKTAILDIAVFALAENPETQPRRVVFVIDRRIVVDQVYLRAKRIRKAIEDGGTHLLRDIGSRLRRISDGKLLGAVALRGGIPIDREWTERPDQPWVMVSTVDQFGSRLLFRGYGVTTGMRPIHAGLAGNDCLVILDEVHLSRPFAETLRQLGDPEVNPRSNRLPHRFQVVEMSATPSTAKADRFRLDRESDDPESDLANPELRRRVRARKTLRALVPVASHKRVPAAVLRIVRAIGRENRKRLGRERISSVGVIVNRVAVARDACRTLDEDGVNVHLLTGRMRPLDRERVLEDVLPAVDPSNRPRTDELVVVVATQAIEVGADFSFDALITECAPIDSLRQRFGRLDRRGLAPERTGAGAPAWILGVKTVVGSRRPDPIYGGAVRRTWRELRRRLGTQGELDVGADSLRGFPEDALAPRMTAPILLPSHLDAWVQTSPEPLVQPPLEPFLHGLEQDPATDVSVLWRWDHTGEALRLVPPRPAEMLQIPVAALRAWLRGEETPDVADAGSSLAERSGRNADQDADASPTAQWVRWGGAENEPARPRINEIAPGNIIVVKPTAGGMWRSCWSPDAKHPVLDLGDEAQRAARRRLTLRLDPRIHEDDATLPLPGAEEKQAKKQSDSMADLSLSSRATRVSEWLATARRDATRPGRADLIRDLISRSYRIRRVREGWGDLGPPDESEDGDYYVLVQKAASGAERSACDPLLMDGSDTRGSFTGSATTLATHLRGVGDRAAKSGERLGLPASLVSDLALAGYLHDLGKVDTRFQDQLVGGDPVLREMQEEPLAKSLPGIRRIWKYPRGMRHEVASVALIKSDSSVLDSADDPELVLHLVGTHHGYGRPLPPVPADTAPQRLEYVWEGHSLRAGSDLSETDLALEMADRFWRLVARYGRHGLAWLEAIFRLADHRQSAEEGLR